MIQDKLIECRNGLGTHTYMVKCISNGSVKWVDYFGMGVVIDKFATNEYILYPTKYFTFTFLLTFGSHNITVGSEKEVLELMRELVEATKYPEFTIYDESELEIEKIIDIELSSMFTDNFYKQLVYDTCVDDIKTDIKECAEAEYNSSDVRLAIQRVILKRMSLDV